MTADELVELSRYPLFPRTARTLLDFFGPVVTAKLITAWPGQSFPVPVSVGGITPNGQRRWSQLTSVVGETAAAKVVAACGGGDMEIPNCKLVIWQRTQQRLRIRYDQLIRDGLSATQAVFECGVEFNVTGKAVENIVNAPTPEIREAQGSLF